MSRREALLALAVCCVSLLLTGCPSAPPAPVAPVVQVEPEPEPEPSPVPTRDTVRDLLYLADVFIADNRLTTPPGQNALEILEKVRAINPDHPDIARGMERIVEGYLGLAERSIARSERATAETFLERARGIDADHPGIAAMAARIQQDRNSTRRTIPLQSDQLRARGDALRRLLTSIGTDAKRDNARITIEARSDAEGRWIYQQLAAGRGDARLRAEIRISNTPQLQLQSTVSPACTSAC